MHDGWGRGLVTGPCPQPDLSQLADALCHMHHQQIRNRIAGLE
jgi:hypothetical protein